jgi:SAM-dependent methyltransferase
VPEQREDKFQGGNRPIFRPEPVPLDFWPMNLKLAEETLRESYKGQCSQYRADDEVEVTSRHHDHLRETLRGLSRSFGRPIKVLDAGCGTGRYFHCLENVEELIGLDLCPEMLEEARMPVRDEEVSIPEIQLICQSIFDARFDAESFDLIYSMGMFGFACPFTSELGNRFYDWLTPGGKLFFNVIDRSGWPLPTRLRREARNCVYNIAPRSLRQRMDARTNGMALFDLSRRELQKLMRQTRFPKFHVESLVCESPLWQGSHLECVAAKPA